MKYYKFLQIIIILAILASCADNGRLEYFVEKPGSIAETEYLNDYEVLKSYVDRSTNPNFKLGAGVSVSDFTAKGLMHRLICSNFDEMTAGWEMKHGAVVQADGTLNLSKVQDFISAAKEAGISIYGHTLCWHANENAAYLNSLIAPLAVTAPSYPNSLDISALKNGTFNGWEKQGNISIDATSGMGQSASIKLVSSSTSSKSTDLQLITPNIPVISDHIYEVVMYIKSDKNGKGRITFDGLQNNTPLIDWTGTGQVSETFDTDISWKAIRFKIKDFTGNSIKLHIELGYLPDVTYWIDVKNFYVYDTQGEPLVTNLIDNGDFEAGNTNGWGGWGNNSTMSLSAKGMGYGGGYCFNVTNPSLTTNYWDVQTIYSLPNPLIKGHSYTLSFWVKGSAEGKIRPEMQSPNYSSDSFGMVYVTTEWQHVTLTTSITADDRNRLIISYGEFAGTVYLDNFILKDSEASGGETTYVEKSADEKKAIIENALESWISGIVGATKDYIKAWDVVNEPMSDWPDPTQLKTGIGKTLASDEFYWQDYMGKDYAVKAIQFARKYGNSDDKLFINDYGLEAEDQKKCQGLIDYIKYIESKGVKVDGIGTQMHVTYGVSTLNGIRQMFQNLAATGKLIKISELDMGYRLPGATTNLKTNEMTTAQEKEMAGFYKDIIKAYFELIPANQRYGITHWSPLDSPENSSWRPGEPIGLWTKDYKRKHTYAGFADGLAGK